MCSCFKSMDKEKFRDLYNADIAARGGDTIRLT